MNDLDERLRTGLRASTEQVGQIEPDELAAALASRAGSERSQARPRRGAARPWLAAAAVLALLVAAGAVGLQRLNDDDGENVVADQPEPEQPVGFSQWSPGWHELDTGPVPVGEPPSLAWLDGKLFAAKGVPPADGEQSAPRSGLWSYDPAARTWASLPDVPFEKVDIVATGDGLVAVGGPARGLTTLAERSSWATWSQGDDEWTDQGALPVPESLRRAGTSGPTSPTGARSLLWTGAVVMDLTAGALLDPSDGTATAMEMPADLLSYLHLLQATPVWTGSQVVVASWSTLPGLAWDGEGRLLGEIPGPPMADPEYAIGAAAVEAPGGVVLLARDESDGEERAARYDPGTGAWTALPGVPGSTEAWCPFSAALVAEDVVAQGCEGEQPDAPHRFDGQRWTALPGPPRSELGIERWLGTAEALIVWMGDADTTNNPAAPFQWAAVWIPGPDETSPQPDDGATTPPPSTPNSSAPSSIPTEQECRVDELPDLTPFLPTELQVEPQRGLGGTPDSEGRCYRHWTDPERPWVHVSQSPGGIPFSLVDAEMVPPLRFGRIHEGRGIEHYASPERSSPDWGVMAYGLTDDEFDRFTDQLLDRLPTPD
jgi:hypothetical protein